MKNQEPQCGRTEPSAVRSTPASRPEEGLEQEFNSLPGAARSLRGLHRFTRLVRLSYLAPDITQAILDGRQPSDLTAEKLLEHSRLPLAWHDQRIALGFA
jgi:hypothetical protein